MKSPFVKETLASLPHPEIDIVDQQIPLRDGATIPLRLYRTRSAPDGGRPVVVNAHGGGWCLGGLDTEGFLCQLLCRSLDIVVVDIGYRLAPEVNQKDCVLDVYDGVIWVSRAYFS